MGDPKKTAREEPFEEILNKLRDIVEGLEQGDLPLEESLSRFEEGIKLSRLAARRLQAAERRVEALLVEEEATRTVPFPLEEENDVLPPEGKQVKQG